MRNSALPARSWPRSRRCTRAKPHSWAPAHGLRRARIHVDERTPAPRPGPDGATRVARSGDTDQLLRFARHWLYEHKLLIPHDRALRSIITNALSALERETADAITTEVASTRLQRWRESLAASRPDGQSMQSWWWAAPAKHSVRQISEAFERIDELYALGIDTCLRDIFGLDHRALRQTTGLTPTVSRRSNQGARTHGGGVLLPSLLFAGNHRSAHSHAAASCHGSCAQRRRWRPRVGQLGHAFMPACWPMWPGLATPAADNNDTSGSGNALHPSQHDLTTVLAALVEAHQKHKPPAAQPYPRATDRHRGGIGTCPAGRLYPVAMAGRCRASGSLRAGGTERNSTPAKSANCRSTQSCLNWVVPGAQRLAVMIALARSSPLRSPRCFALRRALRNGAVWIEHSQSFRGRAPVSLFLPSAGQRSPGATTVACRCRWTRRSFWHRSLVCGFNG